MNENMGRSCQDLLCAASTDVPEEGFEPSERNRGESNFNNSESDQTPANDSKTDQTETNASYNNNNKNNNNNKKRKRERKRKRKKKRESELADFPGSKMSNNFRLTIKHSLQKIKRVLQ